MQVQKLPPSGPFYRLKSPDHVVLEEQRGVRALERPDQVPVYDAPGIMSNVMPGSIYWCDNIWRSQVYTDGKPLRPLFLFGFAA
jgi:hypothetical protein